MAILTIENLSKKFKENDFYSLKNINLTVNKGDIVGLVGKNGSGKSTLLKSIAKSYIPTSGIIKYKGTNIRSANNMLSDFGIMIEPVFYPQLSVIDNLKLYLEIHNQNQYRKNIPEILKLVDLYTSKDRKPAGFSFGMKQRVALAIALIAEPSFLLLDEPFVGLDQVGIKRLINILQTWSKNREVSMIISSHQLSELEAVCTRYVFIDDGQLVKYNGKGNHGDIIVELQHRISSADKSIESLQNLITIDNNTLIIDQRATPEELNTIFQFLSSNHLIKKISVQENILKSYFKENNNE